MKIAIISDVHENFHNLTLVLNEIKSRKIEKILFLGDFINNGIAKLFASFEVPTFAIWGNNDGDKAAIMKTSMQKGSNLEIGMDVFDNIEIDGKRIFLSHYPLLAKPIAKSGDYDLVCYGHNHLKNLDKINDCIIVNPGEISGHKTKTASYAVYDTKTSEVNIIMLDKIIHTKSILADKQRERTNFEFSKTKAHQY